MSAGHSCERSSGPSGGSEDSQLQLPWSGPDGQPNESAHLASSSAQESGNTDERKADRDHDQTDDQSIAVSVVCPRKANKEEHRDQKHV